MSSYNEILDDLKNTLQKEDIESNEEQISLYDLFVIINSKFELLRSVTQNNKLFTGKELFHRKKYIPESIIIKDDVLSIYLYDSDFDYFFNVHYDINSKSIFFEGSAEKFIKKYNEELNDAFSILEIFSKERKLIDEINNYVVKHNYYNFNIDCDNNGVIDLKVNVSSKKSKVKEVYERNYYNKKALKEMLEESKFEVAKKIMIDVNSLKEPIKTLVYKYFNSSNKPNYGYIKTKSR